MKKIETVIEGCKDCKFCLRFFRNTNDKYWAFICEKAEQVIQMVHHGDHSVDKRDIFPDWCPLETYKEADKSEALPAPAVSAPSTIILPGMPNLEWMTENLSGFGGTEINGRTYYTYDEAEEAVKQLGNGWRLPTRGEMVDLDDLGSVWQKEGPHGLPGRLFGGGLFLEASGFRIYTSGALTSVGTEGDLWASSPAAAGSGNACYLEFDSDRSYPMNSYYRASGFTVRCVRNVK